ncbi:radical SAM/SPASM domain-containing protein [Sphaerimonospora cavernae]|uniref:Radical SAM/SPASM domain-containing protein n=1 Tax=Sphaerimonospora cavernae TaxID=1740611 RepID=A0ABV6U134_9ACTN
MSKPVKIWYVAGQRLCNFDCTYCVSVGDWAKSRRYDWRDPADKDRFVSIVEWIGSRPFEVAVRLGSLGEPFASQTFLAQAGWLTRQRSVRYVELVSNGSLLMRRLPKMEPLANLGKLSLWLTYHDGQTNLDKFIAAAAFAQEEYGCFVVVNALLFPGGTDAIRRVRDAARDAGLRFNVDLGYDPTAPSVAFESDGITAAVPMIRSEPDVVSAVEELGGDAALTRAALVGLTSPQGRACRAGHDYVFIDIHGQVHRCSRYAVLERDCYGNVLDPDFELDLRPQEWVPCAAARGCCNKEDFLNLDVAVTVGLRGGQVPSLGWTDA